MNPKDIVPDQSDVFIFKDDVDVELIHRTQAIFIHNNNNIDEYANPWLGIIVEKYLFL